MSISETRGKLPQRFQLAGSITSPLSDDELDLALAKSRLEQAESALRRAREFAE